MSEEEKILTKEPEKPEEKGIPEKWENIPLADMIEKGFRPRVRKIKGIEYMSIRKGKKEQSLGAYTPKKMDLLIEMFPVIKEAPEVTESGKKGTNILEIPIGKSVDIPKKYEPGLKTLAYFKFFKEKGLPVDFSQFIDDIICGHCEKCEGYTWAMVKEYYE